MDKADKNKTATNEGTQTRRIKWGSNKMHTPFANVVNCQSTAEQIDLFFGTNQTWNLMSADDIGVELSNHIILTPRATKRPSSMLTAIAQEYEARYSTLNIDAPTTNQ